MPSQGWRQRLLAEKELQGTIQSGSGHHTLLSPALDLVGVQRPRVRRSCLRGLALPTQEVFSGFLLAVTAFPLTLRSLLICLLPSLPPGPPRVHGGLRKVQKGPLISAPAAATVLRPTSQAQTIAVLFSSLPPISPPSNPPLPRRTTSPC